MSKRKGSRIKMLVIILAVLVVLITGGADGDGNSAVRQRSIGYNRHT